MTKLLESVTDLALEFGFREEDAVVVGHMKRRVGDRASEYHLHVLVPEVNPVNGKVLGNRWDYARQEKVARLLEARWGHAVVQGAFNRMVVERLRARGRGDDADLLLGEGLNVEAKPQGAHRTALVQEVKRTTGRSLPELAEVVRTARALSDSPAAFAAALAENKLRCVPGQKDGRWIIEALDESREWHFCNALHRVLKQRLNEVDKWMGEWTPTVEEDDDAEWKAANKTVGSGRVRRTARRDGRTAAPAGSRQAGDDTGSGRSTRRGKRCKQADVAAGPAQSAGGRDGPGQDRELVGRAGHGSQNDERAAERRPSHPLATSREGGRPTSGSGYLATTAFKADREGRERLKRLVEVAAVEQHYRSQQGATRLRLMLEDVMQPIRIPSRDARSRTVRCAEDPRTVRERRLRFRAMLVRKAHALVDHLPIEAVINLRRVDTDPDGKYVLLTLVTGTQLLDTGDRITVRGQPDDIAISELVACCARRGWTAVQVDGDEAFRAAASRELIGRGIQVVDCPLSLEEQAELRAEADDNGFDWNAVEAEPVYAPRPPWET